MGRIESNKVCICCGTDVRHQKRAKDVRGNYYCAACWTAQISGGINCDAHTANSVLGRPSERLESKTIIWIALCGGITACVAAIIFYWSFFYNAWERENRSEIITLVGEGEYFVAREDWETAKAQYERLFQFLDNHQINDAELANKITEARANADKVNVRLAEIRRLELEAEHQRIIQEEGAKRILLERREREQEARRVKLAKERQAEAAEKRAREAAERQAAEEVAALQKKRDDEMRTAQERADRLNRDPGNSFREFSVKFLQTIGRAQSPEFYNEHTNRRQRNSYRPIDGTAKFDVQRTTSLVSPYIATLEVGLDTYVNGDLSGTPDMFRITFAAQDGQWVLQGAEHYVPGLNRWMDSSDDWELALWQTVMKETAQ